MDQDSNAPLASQLSASAFANAGRVVLADFQFKLETTLEEERIERERHQQVIEGIIARRNKLSAAIAALYEFYPQDNPSNSSHSINLNGLTLIPSGHGVTSAENGTDSRDRGLSDEAESLGGFARGEMKKAFINAIAEANTFLTTDEITSILRVRYPEKQFTNKRVTDSLKDARRRKEVIGENVLRGNFPMFINGLPQFYSDLQALTLKAEYEQKYHQRLEELGFTPGHEPAEPIDLHEENNIAEPLEVTSEDVAKARELLKRPKAALGLF